MRSILVLFLCFVYSLSFSQSTAEKLDAYLKAAERAGIFNGSVLVSDKGQVILSNGYGLKDADAKVMNDANSIFQIGSVTKQFTATIILRLAEQGKLSLNDKVSKYLPEFPNADKFTIEHLLSHTAGIYNYTNNSEFMKNEVEKPINSQVFYAMVKDKPLEFEPGSKFNYSNSGYMLLGYIIEKVTNKPYEQVVRKEIFQPLAMNNSGFDFTHLQHKDKAIGYTLVSDGKGARAPIVDSTVCYAAGAIYSTVGDLQKWNAAVLSGKILKKASLQNAFTPRHSGYGFGWAVDTVAGKPAIVHSGGIHGFLSYNGIFPAENSSIVVLTNSGVAKPGKVFKDIAAILNGQPYELPKAKTAVTVDERILKQYEGVYEITPQFSITVRVQDGQLKAQATNQPEFDLYAKNEREFFLKVVDAQVEFVKNEKGEVEKMILYQNGMTLPGIKKK
ncbi:serine hydrolase [Aridibaculum aurantiacum]|uniref:serine hydrolase n=1 Tax=Aridibaculum aurantiacum TaxID=2810307 RepID=UPI001A974FE1|nr:serine hydrolase [Aridibaculum aurantiacum]